MEFANNFIQASVFLELHQALQEHSHYRCTPICLEAAIGCFASPRSSAFTEVPLRYHFVFTLAASKAYNCSIRGRSNNGNVRINKRKQIKVVLGGFANMFYTPVAIVATIEIVCRLGKHARERKSEVRKAVGGFSCSGRGSVLLHEKLLKPVQYALLVPQNGGQCRTADAGMLKILWQFWS